MRIYIAGPMTGIQEFNFPAFHAAAKSLRAENHTVINPAEICPDIGKPWDFYMRKDLAEMLTCDTIYLLKGWEKSKGALLEKNIAEALGMNVMREVWPGMKDLVHRVGSWAEKTFTKATPATICEHLRREVKELTDCPTDAEEAADCMMLIFHLAYRQGWNLEQVVLDKFEKNKRRTWGNPDAQGVVGHVDE